MNFSFGNQEAYGNPLETQIGIHTNSLFTAVSTLLIVYFWLFLSFVEGLIAVVAEGIVFLVHPKH